MAKRSQKWIYSVTHYLNWVSYECAIICISESGPELISTGDFVLEKQHWCQLHFQLPCTPCLVKKTKSNQINKCRAKWPEPQSSLDNSYYSKNWSIVILAIQFTPETVGKGLKNGNNKKGLQGENQMLIIIYIESGGLWPTWRRRWGAWARRDPQAACSRLQNEKSSLGTTNIHI